MPRYVSTRADMRLSDYIRKSIKEGTQISRSVILWGVLIAAPGNILFYLLLKYVFHMPYENLTIRLTGSVLALLSVVFVRSESPAAKKYFPLFWHFSLIFILPFLFTFLLLKNDFHELWLYWEIFMFFVLILFVPNWLMLLFDICVGVLAGVAAFFLTTPNAVLNPEFDIPAYTSVLVVTVAAGYLFSASNRRGQAAMEKNEALQALAGSIAHEMRNPLSQVKLNLEIIEEQLPVYRGSCPREAGLKAENLLDVLDSLYQHVTWCQIAVKRGSQIISMILDEVKEKPVSKSSFSYAPALLMTSKAIDEYGFESSAEREKITVDCRSDFMFRINETMYIFVLFNLIKNALYFLESRPDARIYITLEKGETVNKVKVKDTGPGISPENLDKLFNPYFTSTKKGGTGLGLSYCKRVMLAFDGDIACHSVEGEYTEFVLSFPPVTDAEIQASHEKLVRENRILFEQKRILVVDDKEKDRTVAKNALTPLGAIIDEAADGREAIEKITSTRYDIVLMNIAMPVMDGYTATEKIREGEAGQASSMVPIVAYTEQPFTVARGRAKKAGMQGLITKPCMERELIGELAGVFKDHQEIAWYRMKGKKVLIADDSSINRMSVSILLQKYSVMVDEAVNGKEALEKLENGAFDLVLMDIGMPVLNGIKATQYIRQSGNSRVASLPVIGFSGESDEHLVRKAIDAGMNDYLIKPFDVRLLLEKISRFV